MSDSNAAKKPWAVFTIVREENFYLPKWHRYYSQNVPECDVYVVNHVPKNSETKDTCCDFLANSDSTVYVEDEEYFSTKWIRDTAQKYQRLLLQSYEAVIFTDVDEIIVPSADSGFADLADFMRDFLLSKQTNWRVTAYSLIHFPDKHEPKFDFAKNIFEQRMYWYRDDYYDKPLVSKKPLNWVYGFHRANNMNPTPHPGLVLIHLHQFDFDWYMQRHLKWATTFKVCDEDVKSTYNSHYRETDVHKLMFQYYHYIFTLRRINPMLIQRWVRDRLSATI